MGTKSGAGNTQASNQVHKNSAPLQAKTRPSVPLSKPQASPKPQESFQAPKQASETRQLSANGASDTPPPPRSASIPPGAMDPKTASAFPRRAPQPHAMRSMAAPVSRRGEFPAPLTPPAPVSRPPHPFPKRRKRLDQSAGHHWIRPLQEWHNLSGDCRANRIAWSDRILHPSSTLLPRGFLGGSRSDLAVPLICKSHTRSPRATPLWQRQHPPGSQKTAQGSERTHTLPPPTHTTWAPRRAASGHRLPARKKLCQASNAPCIRWGRPATGHPPAGRAHSSAAGRGTRAVRQGVLVLSRRAPHPPE